MIASRLLAATLSFSSLAGPVPPSWTPALPVVVIALVLLVSLGVVAWRIDRSRKSVIGALQRRVDWLTEVQNRAVPSLVLDDALRALHANQAVVELLGYETPADVLEAWDGEAILDRSPLQAALPQLRSREGGRMLDLPARRRDGTEVRVAVHLLSLGRDLCVVAFADLSEVIAERERLERIARLEVMGRLAGSVAHDFNNVLAVILAHTEFLEDAVAGDETAEEGLREIQSSARDAAQIVKQLLTIGRRGSEKLRVVDLNDLLASSERMIRSSLGENISFALMLSTEHPLVHLDPSTFRQALLNLAINARDAMDQQGSFVIKTGLARGDAHGDTESVEILVADSGCGMSTDVQEQIFEPFFTTKGDDRGTGLGLATAYATITGAGGTIDVDSTTGRGTTFIIRLPIAQNVIPGDARPAMPSATATDLAGSPHTVLVVDDEAPLRRLIVRALERHGHEVLSAEDGQAAVDLAAQHPGPIDLLLTDVRMRAMNGPAAASRIRDIRPGIRVIFMTGYAEEEELEPARPGEPPDVLPKPFEIGDLVERVADALARPGTAAKPLPLETSVDRPAPPRA